MEVGGKGKVEESRVLGLGGEETQEEGGILLRGS